MRCIALILVVTACAPTEDPSSSSSSSGSIAPPCRLVNAPTNLTVSEGGRLVVTLETEPAGTAISTTAPAGVRISVDGHSLRIKPAYGITGALDVTVHLACGAETNEVTLPITIRSLRWSEVPSWQGGVTGPLGREYGSMWMDGQDPNRLLVFGGFHYVPQQFTTAWDGWALDLSTGTWTELTMMNPPQLAGGRMVTVPGTRSALYYGGLSTEMDTPYSLQQFDYAPDVLRWSEVPSSRPNRAGAYQPGFIFDAPRQRFLSFCGVNETGYHCNLNAFYASQTSEGSWVRVTPSSTENPAGRNGFFYVHDEENERLVMFSGDRGGAGWQGDIAQDLWAFELAGDRWVKLSDGDPSVIGRRNGAFMLDPVNHRMLIWGGTPDGQNTAPGLFALDLDRGEEHWDRVVVDGEPPVRTSGMAVYDSQRARMIVGFGNGAVGNRPTVFTDLWALEL